VPSAADLARLSEALARPDVWAVLALDADEVIGHVALSLFSIEDPEPRRPARLICGSYL